MGRRTPDITALVRADLAEQFGEEKADQLIAKVDEICADVFPVEEHTRRAECGSTDCKSCDAYCTECSEDWPCPDAPTTRP